MKFAPGEYGYTIGGAYNAGVHINGQPVRVVRPLNSGDLLPKWWPWVSDGRRPVLWGGPGSVRRPGIEVMRPKGYLVEFPDGRRCPWPQLGADPEAEGELSELSVKAAAEMDFKAEQRCAC